MFAIGAFVCGTADSSICIHFNYIFIGNFSIMALYFQQKRTNDPILFGHHLINDKFNRYLAIESTELWRYRRCAFVHTQREKLSCQSTQSIGTN